jgi:hypothetical protein
MIAPFAPLFTLRRCRPFARYSGVLACPLTRAACTRGGFSVKKYYVMGHTNYRFNLATNEKLPKETALYTSQILATNRSDGSDLHRVGGGWPTEAWGGMLGRGRAWRPTEARGWGAGGAGLLRLGGGLRRLGGGQRATRSAPNETSNPESRAGAVAAAVRNAARKAHACPRTQAHYRNKQ